MNLRKQFVEIITAFFGSGSGPVTDQSYCQRSSDMKQ
jgi:hypothetical protein